MTSTRSLGHWFALTTVGATFVLLVAGGLVTSQDVGMAVPDWPTTYGYNMFTYPISEWQGGVLFEHSHRLLGSAVGLVTVLMALALWKQDERRWVKSLGLAAVVGVCIQGFLGGYRVILDERLLAVVHGSFAHAFFALVVTLAFVTSAAWRRAAEQGHAEGRALGAFGVAIPLVVYMQVVAGAVLRHTGEGLALHLLGAFTVPLLALALAERADATLPERSATRTGTRHLKRLAVVQLALGFVAYAGKLAAPVAALAPWPVVVLTVVHQVTGAIVLGAATALSAAALAGRITAPAPEPHHGHADLVDARRAPA